MIQVRAVRAGFRGCGAHSWIARNIKTGALAIRGHQCSHHVCPWCARKRAADLAERTSRWIGRPALYDWRLITLTLRSSDQSLRTQVKHLWTSFRRLRQTRLWSSTQSYGRAHLELTYNQKLGQWHPHLHCLCKGRYMPVRRLSSAWSTASSGSTIVDVRRVRDSAVAATYVTKYIAKPCGDFSCELPLSAAIDLTIAARRLRWVHQFGDGPPFPKPVPAQAENANANWQFIAPLSQTIREARTPGGRWQRGLLRELGYGRELAQFTKHVQLTLHLSLPP